MLTATTKEVQGQEKSQQRHHKCYKKAQNLDAGTRHPRQFHPNPPRNKSVTDSEHQTQRVDESEYQKIECHDGHGVFETEDQQGAAHHRREHQVYRYKLEGRLDDSTSWLKSHAAHDPIPVNDEEAADPAISNQQKLQRNRPCPLSPARRHRHRPL